MALSIENTTGATTSGEASTLDLTLTITSANLLMVGTGYIDGSRTVSSIVWDPAGANQSLTQLIREREDNALGWVAELWYLKAPTAGASKTIRITLTGSITTFGGAAAGFIDAHQTTTFGTAASAESAGSDPVTVTASTASGEILIDFMTASNASTVGANQSVILDSNAVGFQVGSSTQAGSDGGVMSWTRDGGGTQPWAIVAVSIKPAGAGDIGQCVLTLAGQNIVMGHAILMPDEL